MNYRQNKEVDAEHMRELSGLLGNITQPSIRASGSHITLQSLPCPFMSADKHKHNIHDVNPA